MRPDELREPLRRQPFAPFRIYLTNGTTYLIKHPEMAWVRPSVVCIAAEAKERNGEADYDHDMISLIHVVKVEKLVADLPSVAP